MTNIKPSEVSQILRQQLEGVKTAIDVEEVGTVLQVGDGIARIYGLKNVGSNELIEFVESDIKGIVLNLEEDNVGAVILGPSEKIKEGDIARRTGRISVTAAAVRDPMTRIMKGRSPGLMSKPAESRITTRSTRAG